MAIIIPPIFDEAFLDWFRERTEATWAALPTRSPEEVLADLVSRGMVGSFWQHGTRWLGGLQEREIDDIERRWALKFPEDYRLFLRNLHTTDRPMFQTGYVSDERLLLESGVRASQYVEEYREYINLFESPTFYNWLTDGEVLDGRFAWLWEGLQFDIEHNVLWQESWGPKLATLVEQKQRVRELVEAAPRLIPVFSHRYLLGEPPIAGNPILSVYQSDIIVYGSDLRNYLLAEFADELGLDESQRKRVHEECDASLRVRQQSLAAIPFWGELVFGG